MVGPNKSVLKTRVGHGDGQRLDKCTSGSPQDISGLRNTLPEYLILHTLRADQESEVACGNHGRSSLRAWNHSHVGWQLVQKSS